jgi:uncharacterized membrane protein YhaH (DUF805 family)
MNHIKLLLQGRMNRKNFFLASILRLVLSLGLILILSGTPKLINITNYADLNLVITWTVLILLWYFGFSICIRRFHDINVNKAVGVIFSFIFGNPYAVLAFVLILFLKGSNGVNKYGEPDKKEFINSVFKI